MYNTLEIQGIWEDILRGVGQGILVGIGDDILGEIGEDILRGVVQGKEALRCMKIKN